jgi:hypothetical protein
MPGIEVFSSDAGDPTAAKSLWRSEEKAWPHRQPVR